jgi:hypothetical protein
MTETDTFSHHSTYATYPPVVWLEDAPRPQT